MTLHHVLIGVYFFLTDCMAQYQTVSAKNIVLNTSNTQQDGATVSILKDTIITNNDEWYVDSTDHDGFHMQINLDTTWGFHANTMSIITLTIDGTSTLNFGDKDVLVSFSVNNNKFITVYLRLDFQSNHRIYPECGDNLGIGDVKSDVANGADRECIALGNYCNHVSGSYGYPWDKGNKDDNMQNSWPFIITLENDATSNDQLTVTLTNPEWQSASYQLQCIYNETFPTEQGLQIYLGVDDPDENVYITEFGLTYIYDLTYEPTADPTADPTKDPTGEPSMDPTIEPTMEPSIDPTTPPTVDPTTNPTNIPTSIAPTTMNPTAPTTEVSVQTEVSTQFIIDTIVSDVSTKYDSDDGYNDQSDTSNDNDNLMIIVVVCAAFVLCMIIITCMILWRRIRKRVKEMETISNETTVTIKMNQVTNKIELKQLGSNKKDQNEVVSNDSSNSDMWDDVQTGRNEPTAGVNDTNREESEELYDSVHEDMTTPNGITTNGDVVTNK